MPQLLSYLEVAPLLFEPSESVRSCGPRETGGSARRPRELGKRRSVLNSPYLPLAPNGSTTRVLQIARLSTVPPV